MAQSLNDSPMDTTEASTSPTSRFPRITFLRFAAGFLSISILWALGLSMVATVLLPQRLKDLGVDDPNALLASISAVTAVVSLVSNLIFGNFSDRTRSRFGRRTPWVVGGGLLGGITLLGVGLISSTLWLTIDYCLCMVGLNMMLAPAVAVLSDRVPEAIRGTMSTFWGVGASIGFPLGAIVAAAFIKNQTASTSGFVLGGLFMGISGIIAVLLWPREGSAAHLPAPASSLTDVLASFIPPIHGAADFWKAFIGRFTMLLSYQMINAYQLYIIQDHLKDSGNALSAAQVAATVALTNTIIMIAGLVGGFISGPISDLLRRRKLPVIFASACFAIGVAMPWLMPTTVGMYLFALIAGFGYAVYGAVDQALNVDVLPNPDKAGKDLGILNMSTTLGQMCGPLITASVVSAQDGSYTLVFPISIASALLGCVSIMLIKSVR